MEQQSISPEQLWARQQIDERDVDYKMWTQRREKLREFSLMSGSCIFTVDVFKQRYDFASDRFADLFGYPLSCLRTIREQGDRLEERIHPDDREQIMVFQVEHGLFIYSLNPEHRNDYQQCFQFRMLDLRGEYVNVISRQRVIQKDKQGKAWMVMGMLDVSPDQCPVTRVKRTVVNQRTGRIYTSSPIRALPSLTTRENEILVLVRQGLFTKEIADRLRISVHTVNNHRKSILAKLKAGNMLEVVNNILL